MASDAEARGDDCVVCERDVVLAIDIDKLLADGAARSGETPDAIWNRCPRCGTRWQVEYCSVCAELAHGSEPPFDDGFKT